MMSKRGDMPNMVMFLCMGGSLFQTEDELMRWNKKEMKTEKMMKEK